MLQPKPKSRREATSQTKGTCEKGVKRTSGGWVCYERKNPSITVYSPSCNSVFLACGLPFLSAIHILFCTCSKQPPCPKTHFGLESLSAACPQPCCFLPGCPYLLAENHLVIKEKENTLLVPSIRLVNPGHLSRVDQL